jgi:transposase, IS5 family
MRWAAIIYLREKYSPTGPGQGRKAYPSLVRLKMTLLQTWYHLSDYGIEEQVNDTLSFMRFCGLQLEDDVPDHGVSMPL